MYRHTRVLGVCFLALLLGGLWLVAGTFTQKFTSFTEVRMETSRIGLQLPERADVKVRGVIVGQVLDFEPTGEGAVVTLGLDPDKLDQVPANVTGSIVPKTLFGEKYVSLVVPADGPAEPIRADAVIRRTQVSTEVEEVLSDLYPLLRAVQPADLNTTLNALATALEGRGEMLGENLERLDGYLKKLNPQLPLLVEDLRLASRVSDTYSDVMGQVASVLRDTVTTAQTLEGREKKVRALLTGVRAFSRTTDRFLADNGDNLIRVGQLGAAQLEVLARYAPQYPCLLEGIVGAGEKQAEAFRNFTLHINLELLPNQPRGYTPKDAPRYGQKGGPHCGNLPNPPWTQENPLSHQPDFDDGIDSPTGKGTQRVAPGWATGAGFAGGAAESDLLKGLLGQVLATQPDQVDDLGPLLLGPMARGAEVSVR